MANKLPEGKKIVIEMNNEGYRNVFFKNKWGDFLNAVQKTGKEKFAKLPAGITAFLVDEDSILGNVGFGRDPKVPAYVPQPVTAEDIRRSEELIGNDEVSDTEGLPPFEPFGPFEASEGLAEVLNDNDDNDPVVRR